MAVGVVVVGVTVDGMRPVRSEVWEMLTYRVDEGLRSAVVVMAMVVTVKVMA
jgi:hypothetical protein